MAKQLQLRKGTTTEHNSFTGAVGELTYDTQKKQLRVHDGDTVGGHVVGAVEDTLTSDSASKGLSARQGKVLKDTLDNTVASSFGVGQTWQDFTGSRSSGVTYLNITGKPIMISIIATGRDATVTIYVGSVLVATQTDIYDGRSNASTGSTIVPAGATYRVISINTYGVSVTSWAELR